MSKSAAYLNLQLMLRIDLLLQIQGLPSHGHRKEGEKTGEFEGCGGESTGVLGKAALLELTLKGQA